MFDILKSAHDEPRGGHFADKRTTYKVLRAGYFWPCLRMPNSMSSDVIAINEWASLIKPMKCIYAPKL